MLRRLKGWWRWWARGQEWTLWNNVVRSTIVWFVVLFGSLGAMAGVVSSLSQYDTALTTGVVLDASAVRVGATVWAIFGSVWTLFAACFHARIARTLSRPLVTFPFPSEAILRRREPRHAFARVAQTVFVPIAWLFGSFWLVGGWVIAVLGATPSGSPPPLLAAFASGILLSAIPLSLFTISLGKFTFRRGRVEYRDAQREVLRALPGALSDLAARIVSAHEALIERASALENSMAQASEALDEEQRMALYRNDEYTLAVAVSSKIEVALKGLENSLNQEGKRTLRISIGWAIGTCIAGAMPLS